MKKEKEPKEIIIYQAKDGAIELRGDFKHENIWASQEQIVDLFSVDQSVVSRHVNNIFRSGEVNKKSNMQKIMRLLCKRWLAFKIFCQNTSRLIQK